MQKNSQGKNLTYTRMHSFILPDYLDKPWECIDSCSYIAVYNLYRQTQRLDNSRILFHLQKKTL